MLFLIAIALAFLGGFYAPRLPLAPAVVTKLIHCLVLAILCIMGYRVGVDIHNFDSDILEIVTTVAVLSIVLLIITSMVVHWYFLDNGRKPQPLTKTSDLGALFESSLYLLLTGAGVYVGHLLAWKSVLFAGMTNFSLLLILFLVAQDMRAQGYALREVITNREGLKLSAAVVVSSLLTAVMVTLLLDLNLAVSLTLTSGFGWYTLSGPLTSQLINPYVGAEVFFIDLLREVLALSLIPVLSRLSFFIPIGYSGAAAFDFTLPLLRENLGIQVVPIAVTSGTVLSLVAPFLLMFGGMFAGHQ